MLYLIVITSFSSLLSIFYIIFSRSMTPRKEIISRLEKLKRVKKTQLHELDLPFSTRVIKPLIIKTETKLNKLTPVEWKKNMEHKLRGAGNPFKNGWLGWLFFRGFWSLVFPILTFILLSTLRLPWGQYLLLAVSVFAAGIVIPDLYLKNIIKKQQKEIQKTLPDVLDLVTVSVEAGLSFDAALSRIGQKVPGQLSKSFNRTLQEIKMGRPRREAFREMAEDTGVQDLIAFINAVNQAEQLGVSISNVLRIQSAQMREKRRQRIQEVAMKAPVKMLLPLVVFIFPTIFIILLGPAVLIAIEIFSKY